MFCRPIAVVLVVVAACGGKSNRASTRPTLLPVPVIAVGACGKPTTDGVLGEKPRLEYANQDLSGDGHPEIVVVDRSLCTGDGNCYWNVFAKSSADPEACDRYAGTLAGAWLESLDARGGSGMSDVRSYWRLTGESRLLVQDYRFSRGGYQVTDALLCRREADDRLLCAEDSR
jgi:hypothetical protein